MQVEKDLYSFLFGEFMLIFFHGARYRRTNDMRMTVFFTSYALNVFTLF